MRVPGNPLIKGIYWLDDVKLTLAQTAAADHRKEVSQIRGPDVKYALRR
jgi:hypothetical protein